MSSTRVFLNFFISVYGKTGERGRGDKIVVPRSVLQNTLAMLNCSKRWVKRSKASF